MIKQSLWVGIWSHLAWCPGGWVQRSAPYQTRAPGIPPDR